MASPSYVQVSQPMSRMYEAAWEVHLNPDGLGSPQMHPGDANWYSQDDANTSAVFELGNLPASSGVYVNFYVSNSTPCSQKTGTDYNGDRVVADIWVSPYIGGSYRGYKYLGYIVYQHLYNVQPGEQYLYANSNGWVTYAGFGQVYPGQGHPVADCWSGPHIHMFASRDPGMEASEGTRTTGISETWSSGTYRYLGAGSELYRFAVDWDL